MPQLTNMLRLNMSYRYMRLLVFFDLPVTKPNLLKEYTTFRKFLINEGFIMMQESVYTKLLLNATNLESLYAKIDKNKPSSGIVQLLKITEKQYADIKYLVGKKQDTIVESDKRLVIF